jgi:hypothetical protein
MFNSILIDSIPAEARIKSKIEEYMPTGIRHVFFDFQIGKVFLLTFKIPTFLRSFNTFPSQISFGILYCHRSGNILSQSNSFRFSDPKICSSHISGSEDFS